MQLQNPADTTWTWFLEEENSLCKRSQVLSKSQLTCAQQFCILLKSTDPKDQMQTDAWFNTVIQSQLQLFRVQDSWSSVSIYSHIYRAAQTPAAQPGWSHQRIWWKSIQILGDEVNYFILPDLLLWGYTTVSLCRKFSASLKRTANTMQMGFVKATELDWIHCTK